MAPHVAPMSKDVREETLSPCASKQHQVPRGQQTSVSPHDLPLVVTHDVTQDPFQDQVPGHLLSSFSK